MQWLVVNTLFQEMTDRHNRKEIGPVLEVTTSCSHGKDGVEMSFWSLSEDNTHSWVRISHGSNKFVIIPTTTHKVKISLQHKLHN